MGHLHLLPVGLLLRRLRGCRFGVILHGGELEHYWHIAPVRRILLRLLNQADLIVANSEFTREQYYHRGVKLAQPIHVVHPGVDTEMFGCRLSRPLCASEEQSGELVLLTVGRLVERKGHATVLKALARLDAVFPNWEYRIVGTGSEQESLIRLASDLHISDKVRFLGFVPDAELPACYAQADIFVMPSLSLDGAEGIEGFGIVYLEAAAYGIPSVAGRSGGVAEAVIDGVTGILVDPHNVDAVSDALLLLLSNENVRAILGETARTRVQQELNWDHQAGAFLQAVDSVAYR